MQSSRFGTLSPGRNGEPPRAATCRSCNGVIWWVRTHNDKNMPVNPDDTSHFETCAYSAQHRGQGGQTQAPGTRPQGSPSTGPVWLGVVELADESDPEWFVVRVRKNDADPLQVGDLIKLMRRSA